MGGENVGMSNDSLRQNRNCLKFKVFYTRFCFVEGVGPLDEFERRSLWEHNDHRKMTHMDSDFFRVDRKKNEKVWLEKVFLLCMTVLETAAGERVEYTKAHE